MISVCMATYNGEKYVVEQLNSILQQLGDNDEIVVSDDGSTDKTKEIIKNIGDKRIKIFENQEKKGCIGNFENALRNSKGDYIFLADQDDLWVDYKVKTVLAAMCNVDCVVTDAFVTDANLRIINPSFYECNSNHKGKFYNLFVRNHYIGCSMAFKRSVLEKCLPFPSNIPMHDIWIGNVAAFGFKLSFLDDKLIYYRRHDQNASSTSTPSKNSLVHKLRIRWSILWSLLLRLCIR